MKGHQELSKFTASGKTFFFNKLEARNGDPYLSINALYGQGNHERITLFEPQFLQFVKHSRTAVEEMTGMTFNTPQLEAAAPTPVETLSIPTQCSKGHGYGQFRVCPTGGGRSMIFCIDCDEVIL